MYISYNIDDFLVFSFFLSNWILMSYVRFVIRSSITPRLSSWRCRCCSQLAPSHYQKIMTRHMTLDDQLNSTLQFTYLILNYSAFLFALGNERNLGTLTFCEAQRLSLLKVWKVKSSSPIYTNEHFHFMSKCKLKSIHLCLPMTVLVAFKSLFNFQVYPLHIIKYNVLLTSVNHV